MVRTAAIAIAITLTACGDGEAARQASQDTMKIAAAREAVGATLRDAEQAEWRNEKVASYQGAEVVCGEVNAPNAFGGKAGFQRYVSNGGAATVTEEQMAPGEFATVWTAMCAT